MGDAFVADLASGLVRKLISLATEEVIQAWNLHDDLITLRERLESIDALLSDAYANKTTIFSVQNWFNKLQAVAHIAEVVMDELAYEATRRKVENSRKVRDFFTPKNTILYRFKLAHKIKSINASFDNIFKWAGDLGLQPVAHLSSSLQPREIRNTPPFEDESQIVGRDEDISYLVQTTCKNHKEDLKVIAIVGMGGQGKTTLARMVYNNEAVINMFPKRIWVTVSDDFNFMKILNQMVVSLTSTTSVLENTEGLIKDLQKNLKGEKFLLVLDDVWNEKLEEWDNLKNSLLGVGGAIGSNILLTTRKQEVVDVMQCSVSYAVDKLSDEFSWELFTRRAFSHGGVSYNGIFDALGRSMVKRCGGLPLAIKTLGGLLYTKKSEEEWLMIQDSEIWKSKGVLSSLRLSYDNLPYSSLKRCFTYFSILPKDSLIYKKELVQIWMALGFLLPPIDSNALMEDIGNEYFNILLWNSLLQEVERDELGNITSCKMHSLVHDLALDLSKHHSVTVKVGHELDHIYSAMYMRLDKGVSDIKPTTVKRNFERVQILYAGDHILNDVLPHFKRLNVLVLNTHEISNELPRSLSMMKYLKHLDISCFHYRLPSYITELYNLQTLRVWSLRELPKKFCNLINLRHLHIMNANERCMFIGIERLTCLQTLPHFVVNRDKRCVVGQLEGLNNLRGELELYGLNDIDNMEEASRASLCTKPNIQRLLLDWSNSKDEREDIACNNEYVMEGLKPHVNLKELMIDCYNGYNFASWIIMMTNLVKITLKDCNRCEILPPLGHLPKLKEMEISGMNFLKVIGSDLYGGLGSRSSEVSYGRVSKTVTAMHPALRRLILWNLPKLKEWIEPLMSTGGIDQGTMLIFPKLEVLSIKFCSKLTRIPSSCFPSLKQLIIQDLDSSVILETMTRNVSSLSYIRLSSISIKEESLPFSFSNMDSIINELMKNNSTSLRTLNLEECQGLTCLKLGAAIVELRVISCPSLTSIDVVKGSITPKFLTHLQIRSCPCLSSWVFAKSLCSTLVTLLLGPFLEELDEFPWPVSSPVTSFPNLNSLLLWGWVKLKTMLPICELDDSLSSTFPSLTQLTIYNYEGMEGLPDSLSKLPSLRSLFIWNCKNMKSLPTFDKSDSLLLLKMSGCPVLEERCMKERRPEWFKIQHIPHVKWD